MLSWMTWPVRLTKAGVVAFLDVFGIELVSPPRRRCSGCGSKIYDTEAAIGYRGYWWHDDCI